jgi:serine/threonine protein kinase
MSSRPDGKARGGRILPIYDPRSDAASARWIGTEHDRVIHRAQAVDPHPTQAARAKRLHLRGPLSGVGPELRGSAGSVFAPIAQQLLSQAGAHKISLHDLASATSGGQPLGRHAQDLVGGATASLRLPQVSLGDLERAHAAADIGRHHHQHRRRSPRFGQYFQAQVGSLDRLSGGCDNTYRPVKFSVALTADRNSLGNLLGLLPLCALADLQQWPETVEIVAGHLINGTLPPPMVDAAAAPIDRYVVLEYLSEGGMGAIYVGKKLGAGGFEKEVVLKQLLPEFTKQEEFIELFLREAKLSATLDHANIVHTIDLVNAGNEYFIVMEYLPGGDMRTLLRKAKRRGNRFAPGAAIYIAREVLSALAYAHAKRDTDGSPLQLIHRDVSPSNVLLSQNGEVKLTDFGIAKAATHTSQFYKVKGKIGYMSPEQARSQELDHRSDLYSLAVCFYEVLTGERLFIHAGLTTSADEIYSQPVPSVSRKVPGVPSDLDAIVWKSLMINPVERYQTAGEFQEALMRCAHRHGLLISAPELASQLRAACGPSEAWRDEEDEEIEESRRAGTEVYNPSEEEDEDDDFGAMHHGAGRRDRSIKLTVPQLLQGIELTSIINNIVEILDEGSGRKGNESRSMPAPMASASRRPAALAPSRVSNNQIAARPGQVRATPGVAAPAGVAVSTAAPAPGPNRAPAIDSVYPSHVGLHRGYDDLAGPTDDSLVRGYSNRSSAPSAATGMAAMPMATPHGMAPIPGSLLPDVAGQFKRGPDPDSMAARPISQSAAQPRPAGLAHHPSASDSDTRSPASAHRSDDRRVKSWMVITLILLASAAIAAVVGLSGPDIGSQSVHPAPPSISAPRP